MKLTYKSYRAGKRSQQKEDLLPANVDYFKILIEFVLSSLFGNLLGSVVS